MSLARMQLPDFLTNADGEIDIGGTRIGVHHVAHLYKEGHSPEFIAETYPSLSLLQVHKCIVFYLGNAAAVDEYIRQHDEELDRLMASPPRNGPSSKELRERFEAMRRAKAS